jgi:hypothetical protein
VRYSLWPPHHTLLMTNMLSRAFGPCSGALQALALSYKPSHTPISECGGVSAIIAALLNHRDAGKLFQYHHATTLCTCI